MVGGWAPGSASDPQAGPGREGQLGGHSSHLLAQTEGCHWGPPGWDKLQRKWAGGATTSGATTMLGVTETLSREAGGLPRRGRQGWSLNPPPGQGWGSRAGQDTGYTSPEKPMPVPPAPCFSSLFSLSASLTMGVLGSPSSCRGGHRKGSEELPAALVLGNVQFLASWTGGGGPGSSQGSVQEQGVVDGAIQLGAHSRGCPPPARTLTIRTGRVASVAGSSGEQRGEGWHAGVPPTHQQLLYAWHLPLQGVGATGDFGKGRGSGWGHPWWGLQPWWLGLGKILARSPTAAMVWGWESPDATVQGSSQGATGWGEGR